MFQNCHKNTLTFIRFQAFYRNFVKTSIRYLLGAALKRSQISETAALKDLGSRLNVLPPKFSLESTAGNGARASGFIESRNGTRERHSATEKNINLIEQHILDTYEGKQLS